MLAVALGCLERGWYVFPCRPRSKQPAVQGGFKAATNDPVKIREWWTRWPDANVAIATGASGLCVLDIDHGLTSLGGFEEWRILAGLPQTYTVRTGRTDGLGVQMYFAGWGLSSIAWEDGGVSGDIRCATGYVMAGGSVHPSGGLYRVIDDRGIFPVPGYVRGLKPVRGAGVPDDGEPITSARNNALTSIAGKLRNAGLSSAALEAALLQVNADRCQPPLADGEVRRIAQNASRWELPTPNPQVTIGKPGGAAGGGADSVAETAIVEQGRADWRDSYHTLEEMQNVPAPSFLIEGFLQVDSITALAAPVAQRKSIIAINIAHALCTGEKLFGEFAVTRRPSRVLYLCPEMGLASFTERVTAIGLLPYVGKTFFCQTMNSERLLKLDELTEDELQDAVVIVDTAVRYIEGDENSSEHMRAFAKSVFRIKNAGRGTGAVVLLHHSSKGAKDSQELTLENAMRGSGELGAFVTSCWATRLQDPKHPHESLSYIENVKQRDFKSTPFEASSNADYRMVYVPQPAGGTAVLVGRPRGGQSNPDGLDDAALAIVKARPELSGPKVAALLAEHGIKRSKDWVNKRRFEMLQANGGNPLHPAMD